MFDFLGRGRPKTTRQATAATTPRTPAVAPPSATQREVVRLTLHNVLRRNGIPGNWIACEAVPIQLPSHGQALLLQLVVMKWHDALTHYAMALQQEILDELKQFDPHLDPAKYLFSWKFSPDCGCPHRQLPEAGFWSANAAPAPVLNAVAATTPTPVPAVPATKPKFDLPTTAADLRKADDDEDDDHGFAPTQINGL